MILIKRSSKMKLILQQALLYLGCLIFITQSNYALPFELYKMANNQANTANQTTQNNSVGLISPTVVQATTGKNCNPQQCIVMFRTRFITYQFTLGKDKSASIESITNPPGSNPTGPVYINQVMIGENSEISYEDQKRYAELNFNSIYGGNSSSKSRMAHDERFNCAMDAPIAAERFKHKEKSYFLGVYDTYLCLVQLAFNSTGSIFDELNAVKGNPNVIKTEPIKLPISNEGQNVFENFFKISAVAILPGGNSGFVQMLMFDEGGRMSSYKLSIGNTKALANENTRAVTNVNYENWDWKSWTLSDLPLSDSYGKTAHEKAPTMHPWRYENASELMNKELNETEKRRLNEHYDLAFIESITYFKGAICFSRGLKISTKPPVRCLSGKAFDQLPSELTMKPALPSQIVHTILALEVFEPNDTNINYHVVYQEATNQLGAAKYHEFSNKPKYWFCSVKKSSNGTFKEPKFPEGTDIEIKRIPIDIVRIKSEQCDNLISFYRYMYQINKPNEGIHNEGKAVFAPWMTFDANAIMAQNDKLYFFLSGNILNVYDYNPNACDSLEIKSNYREFFSSELLRVFAKTYVVLGKKTRRSNTNITTSDDNFEGHLFEEGPPIYTGYRQKLGNEWFPQINYQKEFGDSITIDSKSDSSSLWTLVILMLIILVLLICILYYVFFTGKQENYTVTELKRLASKSKKTPAQSFGADAGAGGSSASGIKSAKSSSKRLDAVVHSSKRAGLASQTSQTSPSKHSSSLPKSSAKLKSPSKIGHSPQASHNQKVASSSSSDNKKHSKSAASNKSVHHEKGGKSKLHSASSAKTPRSPGVRPSKS